MASTNPINGIMGSISAQLQQLQTGNINPQATGGVLNDEAQVVSQLLQDVQCDGNRSLSSCQVQQLNQELSSIGSQLQQYSSPPCAMQNGQNPFQPFSGEGYGGYPGYGEGYGGEPQPMGNGYPQGYPMGQGYPPQGPGCEGTNGPPPQHHHHHHHQNTGGSGDGCSTTGTGSTGGTGTGTTTGTTSGTTGSTGTGTGTTVGTSTTPTVATSGVPGQWFQNENSTFNSNPNQPFPSIGW